LSADSLLMFEPAIYRKPSVNSEHSRDVTSREPLPLSPSRMNETLKTLSKNFKEKNFVALESILNGLKEVVDTTPVETTRKTTNVLNVENAGILLVIAEDVVVVTVVQVADAAEGEEGVAAEVEDVMDVIEADLPDEEVIVGVGAEAEAGVEVGVDLLEERMKAGVVQGVSVALPVPVVEMINPNMRTGERIPLEMLLVKWHELEAGVVHRSLLTRDPEVEVPVPLKKGKDHLVNPSALRFVSNLLFQT